MDSLKRRAPRERRTFPAPVYQSLVLEPFETTAEQLLTEAALQVHRARILDLIEVRSITTEDGTAALTALESVMAEPAHHYPLDRIERALSAAAGGNALLGTAPEEIAAGAMRLVLRDRVLEYMQAVLDQRATVTDLALGHLTTAVTLTSNGQMVQPTTLGHYLTGQLGPLVRTTRRLQDVWARLNRSPLGAVSGVATAVPVRRERVSDLLGFDGLVENTFDALAASDVEFELVAIVASAAAESLRFIADLSQWARDDVGTIAPSEEFVHHGTAQPQRRDPQVLDHLRVRCSEHVAATQSLALKLSGHAMIPGMAARYETFFTVEAQLTAATETMRLLTVVLERLDVNRALTANRTHRGFATSSELADLLAVDCGLTRTEAYALGERIATEATILGLGGMTLDTKLVDKLALEVVGREVGIEPETLGKCLSPKRFVERREVVGGPAPSMVRDMIERETLSARRDASWLKERRDALGQAAEKLAAQVAERVAQAASKPLQ